MSSSGDAVMGPLLALALASAFTATPPALPPLTAEARRALEDEGRKAQDAGFKADAEFDLVAAKKAYQRLVLICRRLHQSDNTDTSHDALVGSLGLLAEVHIAREEFADAESLCREQLTLHEKRFGLKDDLRTSSKWTQLAMTLSDLGKVAEAELLMRDALAMLKRLYPEKDYELVADGLRKLAGILEDGGKGPEAERLYRDALAMWRRLYPKDDLADIATTTEELARSLFTRGKLADAEAFCSDALAMRKRMRPKQDDPYIAGTLFHLATVHAQIGQLKDAGQGFKDALAIYQRVYANEDHGNVVAVRGP